MKDLIDLNNLCLASPLASIVFCCKTVKPCPIRDEALRLLRISKEKYEEVKERLKIEAKGTCYGNLAYCCSPNRECDKRDKALKRLGMDLEAYLRYKAKILNELIPKDRMEFAFSKRITHYVAFEMIYLDEPDEAYRGMGIANPNILDTIFILNCNRVKSNVGEEVKNVLKKDKFISVRIDPKTYDYLHELAVIKGCSVSDIVRESIKLYVLLLERKNI